MFNKIIQFSIHNKWLVMAAVGLLIGAGIYSVRNISVDAVPDITNNQVQLVTRSPQLAPQEVEQYVTYPLEISLNNLPGVQEIRSISRYGLSVITVVFDEDIPILDARQLVKEQSDMASGDIPEGMGIPELMPITTGLGEIYQYVLQLKPGYEQAYGPMELRTLQDWVVKRQLSGLEGIIEVSSFGGFLKQYELALDPQKLQAMNITVDEVGRALEQNNENSGGSYVEKDGMAFYIRTRGMMQNASDIENTLILVRDEVPVTLGLLGKVRMGHPRRYGAMSMDGNGDVVGGITLMLKDANSMKTLEEVKKRMERVQQSLPPGIEIYPYLDRSVLVGKTIKTVIKNLAEGGIIVILVLIALLGNLRAGLIVASIIPLSMLFALILMNLFGVSANLMSLGAIDFGIVVDGAVIMVEGMLHVLVAGYAGQKIAAAKMDELIVQSSSGIIRSAAFGVLIILVVFVPVLTLSGIEGKMFRPMAQTVGFAITGALLLSLTYVPVVSSWLLRTGRGSSAFSNRLIGRLQAWYKPALGRALQRPLLTMMLAFTLFIGSIGVFLRMGSEFIPTLEEGDLAMQLSVRPGSSLAQSLSTCGEAERILLREFPEVKHVVSKIGTAEVPTDPMSIEDADVMIILKEKDEWVSADNREDLVEKMKNSLAHLDASIEFTQPIQLRFNELISGAKTDLAVKIFGENPKLLRTYAVKAAALLKSIEGAADVKVETTDGLQQWQVVYDRQRMKRYGVSIQAANEVVRTAYAGMELGQIFEDERKFDLVMRFAPSWQTRPDLRMLHVRAANGQLIPLSELASIEQQTGPSQISREDAKRRIGIGVNVRERDIASFVNDSRSLLSEKLNLPPGYYVVYGGQFESLENARRRLAIAVPIALILILLLLYSAFGSMKQAVMVFSAVPLSAIGGILALYLRGMPFSISAGIGFIALFGVAVLNGIVLVNQLNELKQKEYTSFGELVVKGALSRLRPVLITAAVASLGFLPMALSTGSGAEVQKPLATVVIGGLITSTLLTLLVLPAIYYRFEKKSFKAAAMIVLLLALFVPDANAQESIKLTREKAEQMLENNLMIKSRALEMNIIQQQQKAQWSLGSTQFEYQYGQINFEGKDQYLSLSQSIPNPLKMKKGSNALQAELQYTKAGNHLYKRQLLRDLRLQYDAWLFYFENIRVLDSSLFWIDKAVKHGELMREEGLLNPTELLPLKSLQTTYLQRRMAMQQKWYEAELTLKLMLAVSAPISTNDHFKVLEAASIFGDSISNTIQSFYQEGTLLFEKQLEKERSNLLPDFQLGYFQQSLNLSPGFSGWFAGLEIPILQRANYKQIKVVQLQAEQFSLQKEQELLEAQLQIDQLKQRIAQLIPFLTTSNNDRMAGFLLLQLQEGLISTTEASVLLAQHANNQLDHLELIFMHNQNLIQLEYHVQTK